MPERYHYAKATNRLGEVFAIPKVDGLIFSEVISFFFSVNNSIKY